MRSDDLMLGAGLLAGPANVIMQLGHPAVGYGVYESRVENGRLFDHPVKRTRTTLTYLAVATMGTDEERKAYRRAVSKQHAQVRSTESSPVKYNALDPALQLWVAACLYRGVEDIYRVFAGGLDPDVAEEAYQACSRLGTTLQVREEMWPADRAAFEKILEQRAGPDRHRRHHPGPPARHHEDEVHAAAGQRGDGRVHHVRHHRFPAAAVPRGDEADVVTGAPAPLRPADAADRRGGAAFAAAVA